MLRSEVEAFMGEARTSSRHLDLQMFMSCCLLNKLCFGFLSNSDGITDHFMYVCIIIDKIIMYCPHFSSTAFKIHKIVSTFVGKIPTVCCSFQVNFAQARLREMSTVPAKPKPTPARNLSNLRSKALKDTVLSLVPQRPFASASIVYRFAVIQLRPPLRLGSDKARICFVLAFVGRNKRKNKVEQILQDCWLS